MNGFLFQREACGGACVCVHVCVCIAVWTGMAFGDKEAVVQLMEEWKNPHRAGN